MTKPQTEPSQPIDPQDMRGLIAHQGDHMLHALDLTMPILEGTKLPSAEETSSIAICGMGGSAIGADLVATALRGLIKMPLSTVRTYALPTHLNSESLIFISSYSGNTEEALGLYDEARARGARIVCITSGGEVALRARKFGDGLVIVPGGMQPRAALAYSFIPLFLMISKSSGLGDPSTDIIRTAQLLKELATLYAKPQSDNPASNLAEALRDKIALVYSADTLDSVNLRWRGQLQENAKHLAFGNFLPELGHNEISGWSEPANVPSKLHAVILRSREDEHPSIEKKITAIGSLLNAEGITSSEHHAIGETKLQRMFSLISLADWTSYHLAILSGVDPTPIPAIEAFKKAQQ